MTASRNDFGADVIQLAADRGVVEHVADADVETAQKSGIDAGHQDRLDMEGLADSLGQAVLLLVGQGHGGTDLNADAARMLVVQVAVSDMDSPKQIEPLVIVQDLKEVIKQFAGPVGKYDTQDLGAGFTAGGSTC